MGFGPFAGQFILFLQLLKIEHQEILFEFRDPDKGKRKQVRRLGSKCLQSFIDSFLKDGIYRDPKLIRKELFQILLLNVSIRLYFFLYVGHG